MNFIKEETPIYFPVNEDWSAIYSSKSAAKSAARSVFMDQCYSEQAYRPKLKEIFVNYKVNKLRPYYLKTNQKESAYYDYVQKVKEQKDYIINACKKMSISDVSKNALVEKCERREYETIEDIDRELAYIDFKRKKTSLMKEDSVYCVNVVSEDKMPVVEKFRSKNNLSIEERLKKNIKSKK